jgi:drug/metabolite transporter (DMT)-like permease
MNAQLPPHKVIVALSAPFFLGMAPIFGKLAIQAGADSFTVAALRTGTAVAFLWVLYSLFFRRYLYIYPAGLIGCIVIGTINGIGSLFYYAALKELDASLVQLINGSYLAFALLLARIGGQRATWRTLFRVGLAMLALALITSLNATTVSWVGVGLMLANALMFAGTVVLSQYVLYEMPSPTAALYILTTMGVVVGMVWLAIAPPLSPVVLQEASRWILMLGVTTALSRVAIFAGVKLFGGMQTAILGITEIGVALLLAALVLGDALTAGQWAGVCLLFASILLIRQQDITPATLSPGALVLANMASVQFHTIAFHRAFGTQATDNAEGTMGTISTEEMRAIQRMMGAELGGIDPFPIGKLNPKQDDLLHGQEVELPSSLRRTKPSKPAPNDNPA